MADKKPTRQGYGEGLAEFARTHEDIVALDADLAHATGSAAFLNEFPERFFQRWYRRTEHDRYGVRSV